MKIGLLVAMDKEYEQLSHLSDDNIVVMKTGIGKVNAALNAMRMIETCHPDVIISSGCAGGAVPTLEILDVVVSKQIAYHDVYCGAEGGTRGQVQGMPLYFETPDWIVDKAKELQYDGTVHSGLIASGDWFVDTPEKLQEIKAVHPDAIAIDMESAAIAQTCYINKVPFVSFRIISDVPTKENNTTDYCKFWENVSERSFSVVSRFVESLQA